MKKQIQKLENPPLYRPDFSKEEKRKTIKALSIKIILILLMITAFLVVIEIVLQSAAFANNMAVFNPEIKADLAFITGEIVYQKPVYKDNKTLILFLGESTTYGSGVKKSEAYPALIGEIDKSIKIINLGVPGITSSEILNRFPILIRKFEPDIVVLNIGNNDLSYTLKGYNFARSPLSFLLKTRTYRALMILLHGKRTYNRIGIDREDGEWYGFSERFGGRENYNLSKDIYKRDDFFKSAIDKLRINIAEFKSISEKNNITLILIGYINPNLSQNPILVNISKEYNLVFVDLTAENF